MKVKVLGWRHEKVFGPKEKIYLEQREGDGLFQADFGEVLGREMMGDRPSGDFGCDVKFGEAENLVVVRLGKREKVEIRLAKQATGKAIPIR